MSAAQDIRVQKPTLRHMVTAPLRLQSYLNVTYLGLTFPLGLAYFVVFAVGLSLSAGLSLLVVGIPLFLLVLLLAHAIATVERWQARHLLGVEVHRPRLPFLKREHSWERVKGLVLGGPTIKSLVYILTKLGFGIASFTLLVTGAVTSAVFIAVPLFYDRPGVHVGLVTNDPIRITSEIYVPWDDLLVGVETAFRITEWQVDTLPEAFVMSAFGVLLFILSLNAVNALAWLAGEYTRLLLGDSRLRDVSLTVVD